MQKTRCSPDARDGEYEETWTHLDVKVVPDLEAEGRTRDGRVVVDGAVVADICSDCEDYRFRLQRKSTWSYRVEAMIFKGWFELTLALSSLSSASLSFSRRFLSFSSSSERSELGCE